MSTSASPTVRRRLLAAELRHLRASTGKTAEEVGKVLGWSKAKISRYELGQGGLKPEDVARLLAYYKVRDRHGEQLLALAEDARQRGWWESYSDVLTEGHLEWIGLEAEAASILEWQINVVPGLLQTEKYAREVLAGYQEVATISPRALQRRLETRLIRQQLLTRDEPLEYVAVLDESVLHRQRGDRSVMHAQLQGWPRSPSCGTSRFRSCRSPEVTDWREGPVGWRNRALAAVSAPACPRGAPCRTARPDVVADSGEGATNS